jgi:hypothetical protein
MSNVGIEPSEEQVINWIDAWQKDLAPDGGLIVRTTFTNPVADVENVLPPDFISVVEFRYQGKEYRKSDQVRIDTEGYITFPETLPGDIILRYRQLPADYINLDLDLSVHPLLQPLGFYYLLSLYYDKEGEGDEESSMASRWMNFYEAKKERTLDKIRNPSGSEPVKTSDALPKRGRHSSYVEDDDYV